MPLHNAVYPDLRVQIEKRSGTFAYTYALDNAKESEDSITNFSVVVHPDPNTQLRSEWPTPMKAISTVKERIGIPGAPPGGLALWLFPDNHPLAPGQSTRVTLISQASPGFTTAATEHFPHLDLTDQWPQQILDELEPVLTPNWIAQHIITIGPRYRPDEPPAHIAADYIAGIQELIRKSRLERRSPFVNDVLTTLNAMTRRSSGSPFVVTARPQTELEAEIFDALSLSLNATSTTH